MRKFKFLLVILLFFVNCIRAEDEEICDDNVGFRCSNGNFIDCLNKCDGHKDCEDGSDEISIHNITESPCKDQKCTNDNYRCNYGGCIPIMSKCDNNMFSCADNSDEWKYYCNIHPSNPEELKSCESGHFIPENKFCNGRIDCPYDQSDEQPFLCHLRDCSLRTHFRCKSGGCIPKYKICDSIIDCFDNSDEKECGTKEKVQDSTVPRQGCPIKKDSNYDIKHEMENYKINPGEWVSANTRIIIKCKNNFFFLGRNESQYRICKKYGAKYVWDQPLPDCIKYCDASILHNSKSTVAKCSFHGSMVPCDKIVPNTIAKVECANSYKIPQELGDFGSYEMTCTPQGNWNKRKINCQPICGRQESFYDAGASEAPWHVGVKTNLYEKCGGTIVSPRSVITALHCVQREDEEVLDHSKVFVIIAGDLKNGHTQIITVNVSEIFGGGQIDIAILKLSEILTLSNNIRPICNTESVYIVESKQAFLHGWPKDSNKFADVFHKTELQVLPRGNCGANLNGSYICVRPTFQLEKNETLCEGHSGSGIIVENDGVNYIIGILSFKPSRTKTCTNEPIVAVMFNQIPETLKTSIRGDRERMFELDANGVWYK
ncbi:modular serine protease [Bactrocera oleae]|uniref:modular serine protease n=1 Tax=Bactrocera oleae TaxID=104688 RepID=UPI00387E36DB